jgi:hypothetical protein
MNLWKMIFKKVLKMEYKNLSINKIVVENYNNFSMVGKFNKTKSNKSLFGFELVE